MKTISQRIPRELCEALEQEAQELGVSRTAYINIILRRREPLTKK